MCLAGLMFSQQILVLGLFLLSAAAFTGYKQHSVKNDPELFALWRVVHSGGTSGAVQIVVFGLLLAHFKIGLAGGIVVLGATVSSCCFFVGPLLKALNRASLGGRVNALGGVLAIPSYAALPGLPWLIA